MHLLNAHAAVANLIGPALEWAVVLALKGSPSFTLQAGIARVFVLHGDYRVSASYSDSWNQGGPIIEREQISLVAPQPPHSRSWVARAGGRQMHGPTPLVAAMRCHVVQHLGEVVDVPEQLLR